MLYAKKFRKAILIIFVFFVCLIVSTPIYAKTDEREIYLGGFAAGFVLNTTTVEVVGLCEVLTEDGVICPARSAGIRSGDVIDKLNDREIDSIGDLNNALNEEYKNYYVTVVRADGEHELSIVPAIDKVSGHKKLGILVKDSVNGIGTVTYVDRTSKKFGSLGHPVANNNKTIMEINGGSIYGCMIYGVKKGVRGNPGELKGTIENSYLTGRVAKNCNCGIFGDVSDEFDYSKLTRICTAPIEEVQMGKANIFSTVNANKTEKFDISIVKIDYTSRDNRNFVIRIDDSSLLETSGGIVQGMSGSPIVQNGKLIGAVTHVFVNDPTRGYGIAIDKMLSSY